MLDKLFVCVIMSLILFGMSLLLITIGGIVLGLLFS